jgi:tetrahydrodipicolinate N-succinyltransferase
MEGAGQDGFPMPSKDTVIGADVWLCPQSVVLTGVRIGHGAIIGAGSVVVKDIPDYAIAGGNPCRVIRYRFSEDEIRDLLEIRWWDWPEEKVKEAVPLLTSDDVSGLVKFARENNLPG